MRVINDVAHVNDIQFAARVPYMRIHARFGREHALGVIESSDLQDSSVSILVRNFTDPSLGQV